MVLLASSVARDELCSLPNATVMDWTGFKDLTAGFMSPWSWNDQMKAGWAPTAFCYGLAHGITKSEGPESN